MATTESRAPPPNPVALAFAVAQLQSGGSRTSVPANDAVPHRRGNNDVLAEQVLADALMTFRENSSRDDTLYTPTSTKSKHSLGSDDGLDVEEKLARNRERNREHARKTRLRKKAHLESLQSKAKGLEAERQVLKQQIEECSIASILLGLSSGSEFEEPADGVLGDDQYGRSGNLSSEIALLSGGSRRRFRADSSDGKKFQPLKLTIDGQLTLVGGGKTHVNWKTGSFQDEDGNNRRLSEDQLEHLRYANNAACCTCTCFHHLLTVNPRLLLHCFA
jgi:bZIP transcription factor